MVGMKPPRIPVVVIEITEKCPLHCRGCYISKNPREMSRGQFIQVINKIASFTKKVEISGGEPLTHPELLRMCQHATKNGIKPLVFTSGAIPNDAFIKLLKPICSGIKFSLRGPDPETDDKLRGYKGAFKNTIRNLELCKEYDIPRYLHFVIDNESIKYLDKIEAIAEKYDATLEKLKFLPYTKEDLKYYYSGDVGYPVDVCKAGITRMCITTDLKVTPCIYVRETISENILVANMIELEEKLFKWRESHGECKNICIAEKMTVG